METNIKKISLKEIISESWIILKQNFWFLFKITMLLLVVSIGLSVLGEAFKNDMLISSLVNIISVAVSIIISIPYTIIIIGLLEGKKISIKESFKSVTSSKFFKLIGFSLLIFLMVFIPVFLLGMAYVIVNTLGLQGAITSPSFIVLEAPAYINIIKVIIGLSIPAFIIFIFVFVCKIQFASLFIIEKDYKVFESIKESLKITKNRTGLIIGFIFATLGIILLGILCLLVGIIPAIILTEVASILLYKKLKEQNI